MYLTENQIALDAQEATFRPGVQMFDHPFLITISPERLASSIELAPVAFRDAFALAWAATGYPDVAIPAQLADLEADARNLRNELLCVERLRTNERALLCEEITARQRAEGEAAQLRRQRDEFQTMVQRQVDRDGVFAETLSRVEAERARLPALKPGEVAGRPLVQAPTDRPILAFWEAGAKTIANIVHYLEDEDRFVCWCEFLEGEEPDIKGWSFVPLDAQWIELPFLRSQPTPTEKEGDE